MKVEGELSMTKNIFVTGGVVSGLGKGITAASLGRLLKARGLKVAAQKLDPYVNVDPGTMSPYQHGEVYVTEDGAETDLDLGHYERFIDEDLNRYSNLTAGKVYASVISKERRGEYLGSTVQVIPHITNEIKQFVYRVGKQTDADVVITEVGGTTGDIESQPFLEAIRQIGHEVGRENCLYIHVTLVPYLKASGEHKSKPTQHSVKELQGMGITPDIIVLRCDEPIQDDGIFRKIADFCNVESDCVIENVTIPILYEAPLMLEKAHLSDIVCRKLSIKAPAPDLSEWESMISSIRNRNREVTIGLVGKYVQLHDAYLSVTEALRHAGYALGARVRVKWIDSETITEETCESILEEVDGILVPGGFGVRGIEGKIMAAQYARRNKRPYLGLCLGMQIAVIEYARNVAGLTGANSREFDETAAHKVIDFMPGQSETIDRGGTLRLGAYPCNITPGSVLEKCYGAREISERHRHRYEVNNDYREALTAAGLVIGGTSPDGRLVETIELANHPFFVGVQYHPEFKSRPNRAHPLFVGFVDAALKHHGQGQGQGQSQG
jgi:CTP synthase